ncbi:DUF4352 domain-containing protein [Halovivax sp.]|uniref:DUF4352 domain-containing protein n=1 Tax=Halovivax sp. TaxID=1935978 RepID=UPI0025B8E612|nr:DUF4352 domain-containing protein [Halovivax sp.]
MTGIDRRTFLAITVAGTIVVAGCVSEESDGESETAAADGGSTEALAVEADDGGAVSNESAPGDDDSDAGNGDDDGGSDDADDGSEAPTEFAVGELVERDGWVAVVRDVHRTSEPSDLRTAADRDEADEGDEFLVVEFVVKNAAGEPSDVEESIEVAVRDEADRTYSRLEESEAVASIARLAPGEVDRAEIAFEIPDDLADLWLSIEGAPNADPDEGAIVVDLEREADEIADLEQDLDVDVRGFGESVEADGVTVTVTSLEQGNNLGGFLQAEEGGDVVVVGVEIANESGRELSTEPGQLQLKDATGRRHLRTLDRIGALDRFEFDSIENGERTDGKLAYDLDGDVSELYWVFDFAPWGGDERAFWKLR